MLLICMQIVLLTFNLKVEQMLALDIKNRLIN